MGMVKNGFSLAINAKIIGSGENTIVLAHGYGTDQSIWEKILPHLCQKCQVLLFDWNFSGDSKLAAISKDSCFDALSDDLITLVDAMELKRFMFMGHSMSGMIGCVASTKRPELFENLILLGASPRYLNSEDYEGGLKKSDVESILSNIESDFQSWALSFSPLAVGVNDVPTIDKLVKSFQKMKPDVALAVAKAIFLSDHREILGKVEVQCTIIQTRNDAVVPIPVSHYMQKRIKGKSSVEIIEADGHFPQLTAHQSLVEILDRVLGFDSN